ncbi:hypothetical protein J7L67_03610 [bacterium]|nr:hypothetical protein [bacterium]
MKKLFLLLFTFLWINSLTAQQMPPAKIIISKVIENEIAKTSEIVGSREH